MTERDAEAAWAAVETLGRRPGAAAIRPLFAADPDRPARMTRRAAPAVADTGAFASVAPTASALAVGRVMAKGQDSTD